MIKKYLQIILIITFLGSLSGCEVLSMVSSMLPSSGLSVDAQLGDKSVDVVGKSSARDIILDDGGTVKIDSRTTNTGISPFWLLTGLIFWQLPKLTQSIGDTYARFKSPSK